MRVIQTCEHSTATPAVAVDLARLRAILDAHADDKGALIAVLQETQKEYGFLPEEALREISRARRIPLSNVYGVATFYAQFRLHPQGDKLLRVCHGTACHVAGTSEITRVLEDELGVEAGQTTPDLAVTLEKVACLGCCSLAPVVMLDHRTYGRLDALRARELVKANIERKEE